MKVSYTEDQLNDLISKIINEQNNFWWGCVIGYQYGKLLTCSIDKNDEISYCVKTV